MDFIRKFVSKGFCIPPIIFRKKPRTTSRDDGVLNEEKMTFPTLDTSNDFGEKVRNVFLGLNADRIFSTHGEKKKNDSLTLRMIEHCAKAKSKIEEDGRRKKGFTK
ncbi:hypothetical protein Tco_1269369, partial [Tanacetum coccineum]